MVCIPAWSIYKLRTLKGPLREVGGKHWGIGTSLMAGGLLSMGAGVQRDYPAWCGYQGSRGRALGSPKKGYRITARPKL